MSLMLSLTSSDLPVYPRVFWSSSISFIMLSGNERLTIGTGARG
jgi:hypothetical protein